MLSTPTTPAEDYPEDPEQTHHLQHQPPHLAPSPQQHCHSQLSLNGGGAFAEREREIRAGKTAKVGRKRRTGKKKVIGIAAILVLVLAGIAIGVVSKVGSQQRDQRSSPQTPDGSSPQTPEISKVEQTPTTQQSSQADSISQGQAPQAGNDDEFNMESFELSPPLKDPAYPYTSREGLPRQNTHQQALVADIQALPTHKKLVNPQSTIHSNPSLSFYLKKRRGMFQQMAASFRKQLQQQPKTVKDGPVAQRQPQNYESGKQSLGNQSQSSPRTVFDKLESAQLTPYQFELALRLLSHSPFLDPKSEEELSVLAEERAHYGLGGSSFSELGICVVVPSYRNHQRHRYYFNLYSLLQQAYSNYRVVIVEDHSGDHTYEDLEKELRTNPLAREKVTLVGNSERKHHMENIYRATHQHCKQGEILMVVDGDDELIGTQVFRAINEAYWRLKPMALYTNHLQSKREVSLDVGISRQYSQQVRASNGYRYERHYYSHLRTCWSDLFLLLPERIFRDAGGKFFTNAVDNAMYYPVFELSCGEVHYLPEITYKYNTYTGNNVDNLEEEFRRSTSQEIRQMERWECLKDWNREAWDKIKSYTTT